MGNKVIVIYQIFFVGQVFSVNIVVLVIFYVFLVYVQVNYVVGVLLNEIVGFKQQIVVVVVVVCVKCKQIYVGIEVICCSYVQCVFWCICQVNQWWYCIVFFNFEINEVVGCG